MPLHVGADNFIPRAWHPQGMPLHVGGPPRFPMRLQRGRRGGARQCVVASLVGARGDDRKRVGERGAILAFAPVELKSDERYSWAGGELYICDLPGERTPVHVAGDDVSII